MDLELNILSPSHRMAATELPALLSRSHLLVDVRSAPEFAMCRIDGAVNYPIDSLRGDTLDELVEEIRKSDREDGVTFICRRGNDSQLAAQLVLDALAERARHDQRDQQGQRDQRDQRDQRAQRAGRVRVRDVSGGLHAWAALVDRDFPVY